MNYNDQILENKTFNFVKQLLFNIVLSVVIVLGICLVMIYGFKYRPYEVVSDSMYPVFKAGDMVVVKAQSDYFVGDIVKFTEANKPELPTTHRIVAIRTEAGATYYYCIGDASQALEGDVDTMTKAELDAQLSLMQRLQLSEIEGKVVAIFTNWGNYYNFINDSKFMLIALVIGLWAVIEIIQNEIQMKQHLRLN